MTKAIYAGTFDPVTYGHLDIIKRAEDVFDELVVATTENVNKKSFFTLEERINLLKTTLRDKPNVKVISFSCLLVDLAKDLNAKVLVRGLRAASDFDYEFEMAMMNRELQSAIETVFFVTRPKYMFISSSLIKEIAFNGGDIGQFVPKEVESAIITKLGRHGAG